MRTAASYKGHPIHAMLVPFPLAFLLRAQAFDVAGVALGRPPLWTTGRHLSLAGIATALLAAASSAVDYVRSAPPESSSKQRATRHALANVGATVLFAATWLLRDPGAAPGTVVLALEGAGAVLVMMGAWMGGTLVIRNQIGVDHRYATAGEWKHERLSGTAGAPVTVAGRAGARPDQAGQDRREAERGRAHRAQLGRVRGSMHPPRRLGGGQSAHLRDRAVPLARRAVRRQERPGETGPVSDPIESYTVEEVDGEVRVWL